MILAEKITILRKRNGWSQEDLADQLGVSRQSISKWESAQSTPDLNRVLALAQIFGVSTDLLLKEEEDLTDLPVPAGGEGLPSYEEDSVLRSVSMEEANAYLQLKIRAAGWTALGVMLCILSPVVLIVVEAVREKGLIRLGEDQAAGIGVLVLMLMVGAAVGIFVYWSMRQGPFSYMEREALETAYGVEGMVRDRMERYDPAHIRYMITGILLCVLSCLPLFGAMIAGGSDFVMTLGAAFLLVLVAVGVMLIVRTSIITDAMRILLEEGEYSRENKRESRRNETVMGLYWSLTTAIYLLISFLTGRWDRTWIIWPVAGVGCGVLAAILRMVRSRE